MNRGYGYGQQPVAVRPPGVPQWGKGTGAASGGVASSSASTPGRVHVPPPATVRPGQPTGSKGGSGVAAGGSVAGGGVWNPAWGKSGAAAAQTGGASAGGKGAGWGYGSSKAGATAVAPKAGAPVQYPDGKPKGIDEAKEMRIWEEVLFEATQRTNEAEDAVAKASISAEMIQDLGEDMEGVKLAVGETEQAVSEAQTTIGDARAFLNSKLTVARRFESEQVKYKATDTLNKLVSQLTEAQKNLHPLKTVRQEYLQRCAIKSIATEVLEKLSPAEVDMDHIAELSEMAVGNEVEAEHAFHLVQEADTMATSAMQQVTSVVQLIGQKKKNNGGSVNEELSKLEERCKGDVAQLTELKSKHKEMLEHATCVSVLKQASQKVDAVSIALTKASEAEAPFLLGVEELPVEETVATVKICDAATAEAFAAVSGARMFLSTKLIETKRFCKGPSEMAQAALKEHLRRVDEHSKKLKELKASLQVRKKSAFRLEAEYEVAKTEKLVTLVAKTAAPFEDDDKLFRMSTTDLQTAVEAATTAEQDATNSIQAARKFITAKQIEAKGAGPGPAGEVSAELIKIQTRLSLAQAEVLKHKKLCASVDQRLACKKIVEEINARIVTAEEKVDAVAGMAETLSEQAEGAAAAESGEKPATEGQEKKSSEGEDKKPDGEQEGAAAPADKSEVGPEQKKRAVEAAVAEASAAVKDVLWHLDSLSRSQASSTKDAVANIRPRIAKAQEKLDASTASVRASADRVQAAALIREATERVKVAEESVTKAAEAEAPLSKVQTEAELEAAMAELDKALQLASSMVGGAKTDLAMKRLVAKRLCDEMKDHTSQDLVALQKRLDVSTRSLADSKKSLAERRQEVEKKTASTILKEVDTLMSTLDAEVEKALAATGKFVISPGEQQQQQQQQQEQQQQVDNLEDLEPSGTLLEGALAAIQKAHALVQGKLDFVKNCSSKGPMAELRSALGSHKANLGSLDSKCKRQSSSFAEARKRLTGDAHDAIVAALQEHLRECGKTPQAFFKELSPTGGHIMVEGIKKFLTDLSNPKFLPGQLDLALGCYKVSGLSKMIFLDMLQDFHRCLKDIAITNAMEVKTGKTIRKLAVGELVEVVQKNKDDVTATGLRRANCRAVSDATTGWITLLGNQGTAFFERACKPYYIAVGALALSSAFESSSSEIRETKRGELFELVEGPKKEPDYEVKFITCKARKDGATGRIYLGNESKENFMERANLLVCQAAISLTTAFEIKGGKSIRKLEVGETMEKLEDEKLDEKRSLLRIRVRTTSKQEEGWLTVKGNQGTAFVAEDDRLHRASRSIQLEPAGYSYHSAAAPRALEAGELVELLEGPSTETRDGASRIHVSSLDDATEGWFTAGSKAMLPCTVKYRCVSPADLNSTVPSAAPKAADDDASKAVDGETTKIVRRLDPGELVFALDRPATQGDTSVVVLRVRADKDGATGYATLRDEQGALVLESEGTEAFHMRPSENDWKKRRGGTSR